MTSQTELAMNSATGAPLAPSFGAFIETCIRRVSDDQSKGEIIGTLCQVLAHMSDDPDVARLVDAARRRAAEEDGWDG